MTRVKPKVDLDKSRELNVQMRQSLEAFDTTRFRALNRQSHELLSSRCADATDIEEAAKQHEANTFNAVLRHDAAQPPLGQQ